MAELQQEPSEDGSPVTPSNWQIWPHLRWAFQNVNKLLATTEVPCGSLEEVQHFAVAEVQLDLEELRLPAWVGAENAMQYLSSVHTDAFVVVHRRRIVCERYFGSQRGDSPHIVQSITKSMLALTAASCMDLLQRKDELLTQKLLPELKGSGYEGARLRDLLDMTCATAFSEAYADPDAPAGGSDMTGLCKAMGWHPRDTGEEGIASLANIRGFLRSLRKEPGSRHGRHFAYQSTTSECFCWAVERAAGGRGFAELLSERLWRRLGQERPGNVTVDSQGVCGVSGGFSCCPRDLARVGQMLLDGGKNMAGEQLVPADFLVDCLAPDASALARYSAGDAYGQAYRNNFWICGRSPAAASLMAYGIHGQVLWAEPQEQLVVVKLASSEQPMDDWEYSATMELLSAVRRALRTQKGGAEQRPGK